MSNIVVFKEVILSKLKKLGIKTSSVLLSVLAFNVPINAKAADYASAVNTQNVVSKSKTSDSFLKRHFKLITGIGVAFLVTIGGTVLLIKKFNSDKPKLNKSSGFDDSFLEVRKEFKFEETEEQRRAREKEEERFRAEEKARAEERAREKERARAEAKARREQYLSYTSPIAAPYPGGPAEWRKSNIPFSEANKF